MKPCLISTLALSITCASPVLGQASSTLPRELSHQESQADQCFFDGKAKARERKWEEALQLFECSWRLKPSYDSAGNLGQVALTLGLYTKAATYLDRCLHMFPASGRKEQRAQIEKLFRDASTHVAVVHFTTPEQSGELVLDRSVELGPVRGPLGPVFVNPGTHIVQLRDGDETTAEQAFLAVAGASHQVQIRASAEKMPSPGPEVSPGVNRRNTVPRRLTADASRTHSRSMVPIFVGAGVSAASFVVAGVLLNGANNYLDDAQALQRALAVGSGDGECNNPANAQSCQQLHGLLQSSDSRFNWSYAMLGLGSASLLATVTYALWPVFAGAEDPKRKSDVLPIDIRATANAASIMWHAQF